MNHSNIVSLTSKKFSIMIIWLIVILFSNHNLQSKVNKKNHTILNPHHHYNHHNNRQNKKQEKIKGHTISDAIFFSVQNDLNEIVCQINSKPI